MSELLDLLNTAERAARAAAAVIRSRAGRERSVTGKGERDFATDVDFAVEDEIRRFLAVETPGVPVLGEERGRGGGNGADLEWVVDPIDGTVNFARSGPLHAVSVGLVRGGVPVVGVVHAPQLGETFAAAAGHGATLNQRALRVTGPPTLSEAVVAAGDMPFSEGAERRLDARLEQLRRLAPRVQRIRMFGTAALDMCWTASGRVDAAFHDKINLWDVAAGVVIAREAGAVAADPDGGDYRAGSSGVVACPPSLLGPLKALLYADL